VTKRSIRMCGLAAVLALATAARAPALGADAPAALRLPAVIGNHMVLQRDQPVPLWGWDRPGTKVTVRFAGQEQSAPAGADGKWMVRLDAMPACAEPAQMTVTGSSKITLSDVLVGEVWLCSGQSNMEQGMKMIDDSAREIADADHPHLRLLLVPKRPSLVPVDDVNARWQPCTPQTVAQGGWGGFSAAAYFFGRKIHKDVKVPVGLIESA